ncbi:uncharacterized conserved protein [Moesziomyces antarcticus T-34]|uniref:H/ACA ribonucleoprotein complex non-core subunit NAF1 n=1 Tax=Pseudozyma antarctica (strain T-34) TaxID=1151754 RepID=M9M457_PSEA3|nr:uncharacterized conserved protein [Moesziomyces antarcticus T-34]
MAREIAETQAAADHAAPPTERHADEAIITDLNHRPGEQPLVTVNAKEIHSPEKDATAKADASVVDAPTDTTLLTTTSAADPSVNGTESSSGVLPSHPLQPSEDTDNHNLNHIDQTPDYQSAGEPHSADPLSNLATSKEDDESFVPPDMEHIVSTGVTQDSAASMQALRELVAQARASSGQPRESLPPGFSDDDMEASAAPPTTEQRGEKRKAEAELEDLLQTSSGIEEAKAAAEQSQHPETKTLLQKALSSLSGLVSRRPKADASQTTSAPPVAAKRGKVADEGSDSDSDSSSDNESSGSDSSEDEDEDAEDDAGNAGQALAADDDDEEGGGPGGSSAPATKNEILAPEVEQPAVRMLSGTDKATLRKLGKVHSIVDSVVVVEQDVQQNSKSDPANSHPAPVDSTGRQGEREGEYSVLDTGSLLCFDDGQVLGLVFETFGSIHNPMYSIRFPSAAAIDRDAVQTGRSVFYLPGQSTYVLTQLLRSMKGSDASNMWDEEVADDEIDYSDDEQEAEAKRRVKAIRAGKVDEQGNPLPSNSNRSNKRQKQHAAAAGNHTSGPHHGPAGPSFHQAPPQSAAGARSTMMSAYNGPNAAPRRNAGQAQPASSLPPASAASLGPAFPHGIASLPPKPSAGLPSRPSFIAEPPSSSAPRPSAPGLDPTGELSSMPRSRVGTAEGHPSGQSHSRMSSGASVNLPAKPIDAAAAAAAVAASSKTGSPMPPHRALASAGGMGSPSQPSRLASNSASYPSQASPAWYSGSGSATPNTPASPAMPSPHAAGRSAAYSPGGSGVSQPAPTGHYNPAYAARWQHGYAPTAPSAAPPHAPGAMPWNGSQAYPAPPLHFGQGGVHPQAYPGYGGAYGQYGAGPAGAWNGSGYPAMQYNGYAAGPGSSAAMQNSMHGYHASTAQPHAYPGPAGGGDAYSTYGYSAPSQHAPGAAGADRYDPRSPAMASNGNPSSTQPGLGPQGQ